MVYSFLGISKYGMALHVLAKLRLPPKLYITVLALVCKIIGMVFHMIVQVTLA